MIGATLGFPVELVIPANVSIERRQIIATKAACQVFGHGFKLFYFGALIAGVGQVEPWFLAVAIASSMIGTSLGKLLLERLSDKQFRVWSNRLITVPDIARLARAAGQEGPGERTADASESVDADADHVCSLLRFVGWRTEWARRDAATPPYGSDYSRAASAIANLSGSCSTAPGAATSAVTASAPSARARSTIIWPPVPI